MLRQVARAAVVVGQPGQVVGQRVPPGRGEDADLAHAAAVALAPDPGLGDAVGGRDQHRADRRAEALGQAHRHGVEAGGQLAQRRAGRDVRVPQPGAVEVQAEAVLAGQRDHRGHLLGGCTVPPPKLCVFSTAIAAVDTRYGPASGAISSRDRVDVEHAAVAGQVRKVMPENAAAAPSSARAMWASESQTISSPGPAEQPQAELVAQRAGRHEQPGLVARAARRPRPRAR